MSEVSSTQLSSLNTTVFFEQLEQVISNVVNSIAWTCNPTFKHSNARQTRLHNRSHDRRARAIIRYRWNSKSRHLVGATSDLDTPFRSFVQKRDERWPEPNRRKHNVEQCLCVPTIEAYTRALLEYYQLLGRTLCNDICHSVDSLCCSEIVPQKFFLPHFVSFHSLLL